MKQNRQKVEMALKGASIPKLQIEEMDETKSWDKFINRFEIASISMKFDEIEQKADESADEKRAREEHANRMQHKKGAAMLNAIGEEGMDIFDTFNIKVKDINFELVKQRFDAYFAARENQIILRHRFLGTQQEKGESMTSFVLKVGRRADQCRLENLRDALVVQVAIMGMTDDKLRNQLLVIPDLDLTKLNANVAAYDSAKKTGEEISLKARKEVEVGRVQAHSQRKGEKRGERNTDNQQKSEFTCYNCSGKGHMARECTEPVKCKICHKDGHKADKCPTQITCFKCEEKGHYASSCNSEKRQTVPKTARRVQEGTLEAEETL